MIVFTNCQACALDSTVCGRIQRMPTVEMAQIKYLSCKLDVIHVIKRVSGTNEQ